MLRGGINNPVAPQIQNNGVTCYVVEVLILRGQELREIEGILKPCLHTALGTPRSH